MLLLGKVVLVTGSTYGIGLGIAERFAREGARLVVNGRSGDRLQEVAYRLEAEGTQVLAVEADLGVEMEVERLFDRALERFGALDVLVNNARQYVNLGESGPFLTMRSEGWDRFMAVNLGILFYCTQRAARIMARQRRGSIINISSIGAVRAHRQMIAYDAMKGAMDAFTRAVAVDLAPWGVRVNSIQPGAIAASLWDRLPPEERGQRASGIPMGRAGCPGDVAWAATFLASDDAAYVTGQSFQVDGGLLAAARSPRSEMAPVVGPDTLEI